VVGVAIAAQPALEPDAWQRALAKTGRARSCEVTST
jgi:hypothetical protein